MFCAEKRKEKYGGFQQTFVKDSMLQLYFLTNEYLLCAEMYTQHGIRFNLDIKLLKKKKRSEILLRDNVMIHQFQISLKVSTTSYFVYKKMFSIH